jgi:hypothetical protein
MTQQTAGHDTQAPAHPPWCIRPDDEACDELHVSPPIACGADGHETLVMSVRLHTYWPPEEEHQPLVALEITEDGQRHWYPMPAAQARSLHGALAALLSLG